MSARKHSRGNKTARGSDAWEIPASLAATWAQRATDFAAFVAPHLTPVPGG